MLPHSQMQEQSDALHADVCAFIENSLGGPQPCADGFDALALRIARFQRAHVASIARLYKARGASLDDAQSADSICAVPCDVFRLARVCVHPPELDTRVFRTSGTSQGQGARGEHAFRITGTYARAALAWGRRMLFPERERMRTLVLAPKPVEAPDSSLSFMLDRFAAELRFACAWAIREGVLDQGLIEAFCEDARAAQEPVLVLGTSFAFVHWLDTRKEADVVLPAGSRVMQTGGFKGRSRDVEAGALRAAIARAFGVDERHVVGEYGMTELSSQAYEGMLAVALGHGDEDVRRQAKPGVYFAPPWMRVHAVDPLTLTPLLAGQVGLARIVDLANVDSAVALQSSDRVCCGQGGAFELFGRQPGALPRGCSIAADAMLSMAGS